MTEIKIVISVVGGVVNGVCSNNPDVKVFVVDFDNLAAESDEDCSKEFLLGSLDDFRSAVTSDAATYSGLAKLLVDLN